LTGFPDALTAGRKKCVDFARKCVDADDQITTCGRQSVDGRRVCLDQGRGGASTQRIQSGPPSFLRVCGLIADRNSTTTRLHRAPRIGRINGSAVGRSSSRNTHSCHRFTANARPLADRDRSPHAAAAAGACRCARASTTSPATVSRREDQPGNRALSAKALATRRGRRTPESRVRHPAARGALARNGCRSIPRPHRGRPSTSSANWHVHPDDLPRRPRPGCRGISCPMRNRSTASSSIARPARPGTPSRCRTIRSRCAVTEPMLELALERHARQPRLRRRHGRLLPRRRPDPHVHLCDRPVQLGRRRLLPSSISDKRSGRKRAARHATFADLQTAVPHRRSRLLRRDAAHGPGRPIRSPLVTTSVAMSPTLKQRLGEALQTRQSSTGIRWWKPDRSATRGPAWTRLPFAAARSVRRGGAGPMARRRRRGGAPRRESLSTGGRNVYEPLVPLPAPATFGPHGVRRLSVR